MSEFAKSVVAQVVEAGIVNDEIVVRHVTCAVDCGLVVNPDVVRAQIESGIIYGLSMMTEKIEFVDGVVQQKTFPMMRISRHVAHVPLLQRSNRYSYLQTIHPLKESRVRSHCGPGVPINAGVSKVAIYAATGLVRLTKMPPLQDAWNDHVNGSSDDTVSKERATP